MYLLAHLAGGYIAGLAWNRLRPQNPAHLGFATAAGLLPDLIDKPISVFLPGWDLYTRGIAHTILFVALLAAFTRKDAAGRGLVIGTATHLVLDSPWTFVETLLWPVVGPRFHAGGDFSYESVTEHLSRPVTAAAEIVGGIVLIVALARYVRQERQRRRGGPEVTFE